MITRIASLLLAASLACATVQAAETTPLAPGKPSGVNEAQSGRTTVYLIGGGLLAVAGFAVLIAATQHDKSNPLAITGGSPQVGGNSVTTTTTTATTS